MLLCFPVRSSATHEADSFEGACGLFVLVLWCDVWRPQPAGGITPAMFGAPVSEKEAEDLSKR